MALGSAIYRRRWLTLGLAGVFLLGSLAILLEGGELTSGSIRGLEADSAQRLVEGVLGRPLETTVVVIFQAKDPALAPDDQAFQAEVDRAVAPLRSDSRVALVTTTEDAPAALALEMANARGALAYVTLKGEFREALRAYPGVRAELRSGPLTITCTGKLPYMSDLNRTLEHDLIWAEGWSLPLAILILLWVFRTGVAAALPVGVGGLAVAGGIAIVTGLSRWVDIAQYTLNVCSLIGLGVAIDYSLFTVSRYREELTAGFGYAEALDRTMASAGRVVLFSGLAVGTGLSGLLFFEGSYLWAMGLGGAIVVGLAVLFALTFLPALLAVLGPRIHAGRLPWQRERTGAQGAVFWRRVAEWVMRRPLQVLVPTLSVLLLMGVPFLHLRLAAADARVLGHDIEARRGYDLLASDFPEQGQNRLLLAVTFPQGPVLTAARLGGLWELSQRLHRLPHVMKVESLLDGLPVTGRDASVRFLLQPPEEARASLAEAAHLTLRGQVAIVSVVIDVPPEAPAAEALVREIRSQRGVADGHLSVGGPTATNVDSQDYIFSRTPRAVGFVVGATMLTLFWLLGSVVLPLKALAMNLLSIAGSFGAMVWVFQDGHLFIREPRPLEPSLPVLLFCMLFGLSMDYEVLMLSRMKESFARTGDNRLAVAEGLERTGGLITSAALIMVSVFSAFAFASVVLIQAVGLGMALAVALDATLVRVLLVPATMRLFGDLNWWAPAWLRRLRRIGHRGG